jgi:hypothetical protein
VLLAKLNPVAKFFLIGGGIVAGGVAMGAGVGAAAAAIRFQFRRSAQWADWIGIGTGLGAIFGFGVLIGTLLTTGLGD